jgi:hypothetical protein
MMYLTLGLSRYGSAAARASWIAPVGLAMVCLVGCAARLDASGSAGAGGGGSAGTPGGAGGSRVADGGPGPRDAGTDAGDARIDTAPAGSGGRAMGGAGAGGGGGGQTPEVFSSCRFHFGTIDTRAKSGGAALIAQLDYFTPGWMLGASFDHKGVCDDTNPGGVLANKVPVVVAYVAAGNVKRDHKLCDCNVAGCAAGTLCTLGAQFITQDWAKIVNAYLSYSQGFAACYGTTRPIVFEMEPDWYQYTGSSQSQPWTAAQAGQHMTELVTALKTNLPNARFSLDVSPWVAPNNGADNGAAWFANFDMSLFSFVNTSGGGTNANTAKLRPNNNMTWAGLRQVTGKPILADTGYGANGISAGPDPAWDVADNIDARIADGVVSIAQYNPAAGWSGTISAIRGQLAPSPDCP